MYDEDENSYLDFLNNYTTLIHGRSFAPVVEVVKKQAEHGISFSAHLRRQAANRAGFRLAAIDTVGAWY